MTTPPDPESFHIAEALIDPRWRIGRTALGPIVLQISINGIDEQVNLMLSDDSAIRMAAALHEALSQS